MPIDNNFFAEALPKHEHRTLHILLSILACVVVIGSIVIYRMNLINTGNEPIDTSIKNNGLSEVEITKVAEDLNMNSLNKAPVTSIEMKNIADNLNKQSKMQEELPDEEAQNILNSLNNK